MEHSQVRIQRRRIPVAETGANRYIERGEDARVQYERNQLFFWTKSTREHFPCKRSDRGLAILEHSRTWPPVLDSFIRDWVNWKYLATAVSGARPWRAPGTRIQNIGEPCGWHERKQARRRATNAKEEARFLRGESGSIRLPGQPSPRLTHPAPANHEIFCAYIYIVTLLLIANCKNIRIIDAVNP